MKWIKKQWKNLTAFLTVALVGGGLIYNGMHVAIIPTKGIHKLKPDFGVVYANAGQQIQLKAGQRLIQVEMVFDSGKIVRAYADTLDTDTDIGIMAKFTQCRK